MPTFDAHKNFAASTVATAPSPATSGLSLTVATGEGVLFPAVPFNATVWPTGVKPTVANAEIVRVTNIAGDVLTIVRAQESSAARTIIVGDQIANTATIKVFDDIETAITAKAGIATFVLSDNYQRFTITDAAVLSTSKIIGTLQRPNVELVDDPGWFYDYNVVKVANGSFDIMVYTSQWGEVADGDLSSIIDTQQNLPDVGIVGISDTSGFITGDGGTSERIAFPFTPLVSGAPNSILLYLSSGAGVSDSLIVEIQTDTAGVPSGTAVGVGGLVSAGAGAPISITISLVDHPVLVAGTQYWIVGRRSILDNGNVWFIYAAASGTPHTRQRSSGSTWSVISGGLGGPMWYQIKYEPIFNSELLTLNYLVL